MPVFGQPLSALAMATNHAVPPFLERCFSFLADKLAITGIFRVPGADSEIRRYASIADAAGNVEFSPNTTAYVVANLLTRFIRQLPNHLLDDRTVNDWMFATTAEGVRAQIDKLPRLNKAVLSRVLAFFSKVIAACSENQMNATNIAIILSPILIENATNKLWLLPRETVILMFDNYNEIFKDLNSFDENGEFLSSERYEELVGGAFADLFCQTNVGIEFEPVVQEKQRKMCRRVPIQKMDWEQMLTALLSTDRKGVGVTNTVTPW
jgi:hypothetical protein